MSELSGSRRLSRGVIAGLLTVGLLSGCAETVQSNAEELPAASVMPGDMKLCYPLVPKAAIKRDLYNSPDTDARKLKQIKIHQEPNLTAMEYPGPMPDKVAKHVKGAAVRVDSNGNMGSGFIVDPNVVVTAAHVVISEEKTDLSNLEVTDTRGNVSKVVSGCYALGGWGQEATGETEQVDIAVLRLAKPLGTTTLKLASHPPKRGETVGFYNFQQDRKVNDPANYSGIALDLRSSYASNIVLTGLGPEDDEKLDSTVAPGASGGVGVEFNTGDVYGMATSEVPVYYDSLDSGFNVSYVPSRPDKGVTSLAGIMDVVDIQYALSQGQY